MGIGVQEVKKEVLKNVFLEKNGGISTMCTQSPQPSQQAHNIEKTSIQRHDINFSDVESTLFERRVPAGFTTL